MTYLGNSFKRTVKIREFPDEGYLAEKALKYKKKRSGYVGQLTKAINKIEKYFSKNHLTKLEKHDNSLDDIIGKIRFVTTELNKLVVKDRIAPEEVLNFCTEQEVRVINIRKSISTILLPEMTQSPHQELFSPVKTAVLGGEENEIPVTLIQSSHPTLLINQKGKGLNFESEFSGKSFHPDLNTSQIYNEVIRENRSSVRSKNSSSMSTSSKPSSKIESSSSSSVVLYLSLNERDKTTEHAKMLVKEVQDRLNKIELLERNFESEKEKLREQVLIAHETANIAQFDSYFGEVIPDEAKSNISNARFTHTLSPIDFKTNQIFEAVASSCRQTKPTHSSTISLLTASSSKGSNSSEVSRFKPIKPQLAEIHIKPVPRNVKHFQLENNHQSPASVLTISPTVAYDHTTHDSDNITSCNQITNKNLFSTKAIPNCEMVDKLIDDLIEGVETKLPVSRHPVDVSFAIQQEYESRRLPPMILRHFRRNSAEWSEFISNFYIRVHMKI